MSNSPSSVGTNEDPTGPASKAAQAVITLTPRNAAAKSAFSDVVGWTVQQSQNNAECDNITNSGIRSREHVMNFMWVAPKQTTDADVSRFIRQHRIGRLSSSPSSSFEATTVQHIEPETEAIWTGFYFLDLGRRPLRPAAGWRIGRLHERTLNDFVLSVDDSSAMGVRVRHIILQVHSESGRIYVRSVTNQGEVEVDGTRLSSGQMHVFNNRSTSLRIGQLAYTVEYAPFSFCEEYREAYTDKLADFVQNVLGKAPLDYSALTPTPSWPTNITVGQWTISSAGTIGSGGGGRVSSAMNPSGQVIALKRITATKNSKVLERQINTLQLLTKIADDAKDDRILRLVEFITDDPTGSKPSMDVWFALSPALRATLYDYRHMALLSTTHGAEKTKRMIKSILEALEFLHSKNWIHGDIKPQNIGVQEWNDTTASVVLIDLEDAIYAPKDHVPPAAESSGTVGWLSPERELTGFTTTADVWAVGVAAIWLLFGRHPWPCFSRSTCPVNPWRAGTEFERHRPQFHASFAKAVANIRRRDLGALGEAILCMIRHPYALDEHLKGPRPTSKEVLAILNRDQPASRQREEALFKRLC